jgi:hypothetical protein
MALTSDLITMIRQSATTLLEMSDKLAELEVSFTALGLSGGATILDDEDMVGQGGVTKEQIADANYAISVILSNVNNGNRATLEKIRTGWTR